MQRNERFHNFTLGLYRLNCHDVSKYTLLKAISWSASFLVFSFLRLSVAFHVFMSHCYPQEARTPSIYTATFITRDVSRLQYIMHYDARYWVSFMVIVSVQMLSF